MAIMGFSAGAEMSQLRTQRTLAMQAAAPTAAVAPTEAVAAADGATANGAAGDAAIGAMAVQEPPAASKTILQSVLKGAMTGASVSLGIKQFGPLLGKIPFVANLFGKLPVAGAVGTGLLGFLGKIPVLGGLLGKAAPFLAKTGLQGFLITGLVGAGIGAIFGAVKGVKQAKTDAAAYAEAVAAQQQAAAQAAADAAAAPNGAAAQPVDEAPPAEATQRRFKSWIIARSGNVGTSGGSTGTYTIKKGDTIAMLAKRFYTTEAEIRKLNPNLGSTVEAGEQIKLKRKVIPTAKAWKG